MSEITDVNIEDVRVPLTPEQQQRLDEALVKPPEPSDVAIRGMSVAELCEVIVTLRQRVQALEDQVSDVECGATNLEDRVDALEAWDVKIREEVAGLVDLIG